jgi:hypothetical protein
MMKIVRWAAVVAFLILTANVVLADGVGDPKFQTIGGGHSTVLTPENIGTAFQITYVTSGPNPTPTVGCGAFGGTSGNTCILQDFINFTGNTFTSISFLITSASAGLSFTSDPANDPYFTNTEVTTVDGQTLISFFGTDETHPGILSATSVSCDPETGDCTGSGPYFPGGGDFPVPEFDFGILVDVSDAPNGSFTAQGSAAVPEPKSIYLMLAGAALVGLFLSKRAAA